MGSQQRNPIVEAIAEHLPFLAWVVLMIILLAFAAFAPRPARAAGCGQFFGHSYAQSYSYQAAVPVVALPSVYYQAGRDIEAEALAEKVARLVAAKLEAQHKLNPQSAIPNPQSKPSAVAEHCGKCHGGTNPKKGLVYDGVTAIACRQVTAALRSIRDEAMPQDHQLTPEQKGAVMEELLGLEQPAGPVER